jgi:putative spermidine/putrescine transport system substrate-binding protein
MKRTEFELRRYLSIAAAAVLAVSLVSCSPTTSTPDPNGDGLESGPLTVGIWGGVWEKALNEVIDGFSKEYGVEVVLDIGNSSDRVAKLQASQGSSMDVVFLTPEAMISALDSDVLGTMSVDSVPNLAKVESELSANFAVDGGYYAAPISWSSMGILWRSDLVPFEITSLSDLWRPELQGRVAVQNMPTLGAASFLIAASHAFGGTQTNLEPGWDAMKKLSPNIQQFYAVSSDALSALVAGDLWAVSTIANQGMSLADKNVKVTLPSEGVSYSIQAAAVTSGTSRPNLAKAFVDYLLRPDVQAVWAEAGQAGPSVSGVKLSDTASQNIAENPSVIPNLLDIDFQDMSDNMQAWSERWQREVAR